MSISLTIFSESDGYIIPPEPTDVPDFDKIFDFFIKNNNLILHKLQLNINKEFNEIQNKEEFDISKADDLKQQGFYESPDEELYDDEYKKVNYKDIMNKDFHNETINIFKRIWDLGYSPEYPILEFLLKTNTIKPSDTNKKIIQEYRIIKKLNKKTQCVTFAPEA